MHQTLIIADAHADMTGSKDASGQTGAGALVVNGAGTVSLSATSTYTGGLLGPMMLTGLGMGLTFVPLSLLALAKVPNKDAGVASSLLNTGQQVGGCSYLRHLLSAVAVAGVMAR